MKGRTIPTTGNAKLTIAYASSDHAQNWIYINGSRVTPSSGYYPPNGGGNAFLRQSNHAKYGLATFDIPYSKLKAGQNTLKLQMPSTSSGSNHIMYDYISLEGELNILATSDFIKNNSEIKIYPNPTSENINIQLANDKYNTLTITVHDLLGKALLFSSPEKSNSGLYSIPIKNKLSPGVYIVNVKTDQGNHSSKIVIE